ncbi:MAG: CPBP family intramembrane metalloprotease [Phycisphaerales bacterium]|nr:CPBP family intramembrane metalloprotease [Phycisphaerales bacterium]
MEQLPTSAEIVVWAWTALSLVVGGVLLARRGFRIAGPSRIEPPANVGNLLILFFIVAGVWIGIPSFLGSMRGKDLSTTELVVIGAVSNLAGILVFIVGNGAMRRGGMGGVRLDAGGIRRGIGWGAVGLFLIEPLIFWSGVLTELIYRKYGVEHPDAHEMLEVFGSSHALWMQALIVVTAVVLAPIFEEILFRGLIQTLISQGKSDLQSPINRPHAGRAWLAIFLSALLFASVHEPWTMPPIFVLALCLGYAYERTGNLWTSITMHALFNLVSVVQYQWLMVH